MADLFDWAARTPYPTRPGTKTQRRTSVEAAKAVSGRAATLREAVRAVLARHPAGMTADEVAEFIGETVLAVRPRVSELSNSGHILDTGMRRKNASGRSAVVWRLI